MLAEHEANIHTVRCLKNFLGIMKEVNTEFDPSSALILITYIVDNMSDRSAYYKNYFNIENLNQVNPM